MNERPLVLVDADVLGRHRTGDETYVAQLLRELPAAAPDLRFAAITRDPSLVPEGVEPILLPARSQELRMAFSVPRLLRRVRPALAHFVHALPLVCPAPAVVTVQDLSWERYPSVFGLAGLAEIIVEYVLGFAFGWTIFQALFMRDMAGGSYLRALSSTFISELLSMNLLMAGMVPTVMALKSRIASAADPTTPHFWFVMSMGLLVGFIFAYPMNWWLVAYHLKHGMMTVHWRQGWRSLSYCGPDE